MVHPRLTPATLFQIRVENSHLVFRGNAAEAAGCVLRGTLVLSLTEPTKVKSVGMRFVGKMKVSWSDGVERHQRFHKETRIVIDHWWDFLPPAKTQHHLMPDNYHWDFELPLPGSLPETVEGAEGASVQYHLKAVVERPTFALNITAKQPVRITRILLPSALEYVQSMTIANEWANKLVYEVMIPAKAYGEGERIPVVFRLEPLSPGLRVKHITCTIKEYITLTAHGRHHRTDGRIVKYVRDDAFPCDTDDAVWEKTEVVDIPHAPAQVCIDTQNDLIRIKHKLKFTVSLINPDGHISELRAALPIIITSSGKGDEIHSLPPYDESFYTLPYDPALADCLANAIVSEQGQAPTQQPEQHQPRPVNRVGQHPNRPFAEHAEETGEEPFPYDVQELMRIPSYRSAARELPIALPISASLPPYEA
ncbi:uncharacterized protein VTP21DRAFT_2831 [Calcarisporiella thermophila]|uniref:uncharacterized protein n=1 Tax=Calcarisporiella thermophila TaxID=911321 RepID=UPI003743F7FE